MGVPAQIAQNVFRATERAFGIDHPIGAKQRTQPSGEGARRLQMRQCSAESQLAFGVKLAKSLHELAAEDAAENFHRQEEVGL